MPFKINKISVEVSILYSALFLLELSNNVYNASVFVETTLGLWHHHVGDCLEASKHDFNWDLPNEGQK